MSNNMIYSSNLKKQSNIFHLAHHNQFPLSTLASKSIFMQLTTIPDKTNRLKFSRTTEVLLRETILPSANF